ncbi:EpsI family protein [candidate division WS5 bacterium]|uniref:EpsI family protein n=1 Tax=candidate division WS5 bacterium TaxID=2093353 RepID=A0A419DEG7_9BACT|nr:MAG: EpsI family protein [candidate division WS5 bacterium]
MDYKFRIWVVILLLVSALLSSYVFPKAKYKGTGFVLKLNVPTTLSDWIGEDVSKELNINPTQEVFNFISDAIAYQYTNNQREKLLFIILDAGNFHHPKVCFTSAGYKIKELEDKEFKVMDHTFKTHALFTERGKENFLSFYWIVVDKNVVHEWIEQKLKQLYFSLFNKKRVGLMVRIDIPTTENNIKNAMNIAEDFITKMSAAFPKEDKEYIFGGKR